MIGGAYVQGQTRKKRAFYEGDPELVRWAIDQARTRGKKPPTISVWRAYWNWFHAWMREHGHRGDVIDWKLAVAYLQDVEASDKSVAQKKQNLEATRRLFEWRLDETVRAIARGDAPAVPEEIAAQDLVRVEAYVLPSVGQVQPEVGWLPYDLEVLWKIVDVADREGYGTMVRFLTYSWARVAILGSPWDSKAIVAALPKEQRKVLAPIVYEKAPRFFDLDKETWHGPMKGHVLKTIGLHPALVDTLRRERAEHPDAYGPCPSFPWSFSDGLRAPAGIPCAACGEEPEVRWIYLGYPPQVYCDPCLLVVLTHANSVRGSAAKAAFEKLELALETTHGIKENLHAHRFRETAVSTGLDRTNLREEDLRKLLAQKNVAATRYYDKRGAKEMKDKLGSVDLVAMSRVADGQEVARAIGPVDSIEQVIASLHPDVRQLVEPMLRGAQEMIRRVLEGKVVA